METFKRLVGLSSYEQLGEDSGGGINWPRLLCVFGSILLVCGLIGLIVGLSVGLSHSDDDDDDHDNFLNPVNFEKSVQISNLMGHLNELQKVSATFPNNARSVLFGYNVSKDYVVSKLQGAGYTATVQPFSVPMTILIGTPSLTQTAPTTAQKKFETDFRPFSRSPNGNITNVPLVAINNLGCSAADYPPLNATLGRVALIKRGNCTFAEKLNLAQSAGVVAALIWAAESEPGLFSAAVADASLKFPVVSLTFFVGVDWQCKLAAGTRVNVTLIVNTQPFVAITSNVIADTKAGSDDAIVFVGAHLDSVDNGPGINDNGSGSSLALELALQLARLRVQLVNKIRFGWFGAEELGMLGSEAYVNKTSAADLKKIAVYLNFDMVGSPNFFIGIYDGTGKTEGSLTVTKMFQQYFKEHGFNSSLTPFDDPPRSDYGPFMKVGIAAGGLFSGAEKIKSTEERTLFGGLADTPYDPCYHRRCDTVENVNQQGYVTFARAAAFVVSELAGKKDLRAFLRTGN